MQATTRKEELERYLIITPDISRNIYPFKGVRLTRADITLLLFLHDGGNGPVKWEIESQRMRKGLDLRGADLRGADLHSLPLARLIGGLDAHQGQGITTQQRIEAAIDLRGANLRGAHLEGAILYNAQMEGATCQNAHLQSAKIRWANLKNAHFREADLTEADLRKSHMEGASLRDANLERTDLCGAYFDAATRITTLDGARLADIQWGAVQLAEVKFPTKLGDELAANGTIPGLREAARAYRSLSLVTKNQGLEEAARLAYRAKIMERKLSWHQHHWLKWLFSMILATSSGYGYKAGRIIILYIGVVGLFAFLYWRVSLATHDPYSTWQVIAISVQSLHGRSYELIGGDTQTIIKTIEAFVGIFIEALIASVFIQKILGN